MFTQSKEYGFPVVTSQETEIVIPRIKEIRPLKDGCDVHLRAMIVNVILN